MSPSACLVLKVDVHFIKQGKYVNTFKGFNIFFRYENKPAIRKFNRYLKHFDTGTIQYVDAVNIIGSQISSNILKRIVDVISLRSHNDYKTDIDVDGFYITYGKYKKRREHNTYYGKIFI